MTLHRLDALGDDVAWCGANVNAPDQDGTVHPIASPLFAVMFAQCPECVVMHGDVLPRGHKKPVDDGFNGDCPRCGRRTYTGATPAGFEHQGGPCT